MAELAPAPDVPTTVTNVIDLPANGRWGMGRRLVPFVSIAFLSALISCSKLPVEEVGGAERDHVVVSRSAA